MQMNNGRDKLPWSQEIWDRIDQAVHEECYRTKIAQKFLPIHGPVDSGTLTVPSDTVIVEGRTLTVNEAATTPLIELQIEFTLRPQQVEREEELMTVSHSPLVRPISFHRQKTWCFFRASPPSTATRGRSIRFSETTRCRPGQGRLGRAY